MSDEVVITCALTGVLTNPEQHPVPVTAAQMARSAKEAFDAGATVMHVHFRRQEPGLGHLPSWEPEVAVAVCDAIRAACPGVLINQSTGVVGPDISGPVACLRAVKPEIAAANAGTLNYLKTRRDGRWAWPPMVFDNPVEKLESFLTVMDEVGTRPEFECFDTGILRSVAMYDQAGLVRRSPPSVNLVMGVSSGMPSDPDLLELLVSRHKPADSPWQVTAIGRAEVWDLHRRTAELGGMLRTGVEDTFYLPSGERCRGNGDLIEALVQIAEEAGRTVVSAERARALFA